jgi:hypothetical protein
VKFAEITYVIMEDHPTKEIRKMNETSLSELAEQVAELRASVEDKSNKVLGTVGAVTVVVGSLYVVNKLVQNVRLRRQVRKLEKKK